MGPKSQLDWLGVVSLWVGALLLAIKAAGVPLMTGAPTILAAGFWNYVPLALIRTRRNDPCDNARAGMADNPTIRTAERIWPEVRAALLTVHKAKGIPMPAETGRAHLDLEAACRVMERAGPFLKRGHDEEARAAAAEIVERINRAQKGQGEDGA